jgi:hypothetical protein
LGEHLLCTQEVIGSIPFTSTTEFNREGKDSRSEEGREHPAEAGFFSPPVFNSRELKAEGSNFLLEPSALSFLLTATSGCGFSNHSCSLKIEYRV